MKKLIETNRYLKNPATKTQLMDRYISTSSAVEGIKISSQILSKDSQSSKKSK